MALAKEKKGTGFSGIFVIMLLIALILDLISAFLGIAEFFIGGLPLISAFVNGIGAVTIGVWLYFQGKKELKANLLQRLFARIGLSSVVEAIPVLNFLVPTWTINVLSTLEYRRILYLIMIAGVAITPALLISLYNALQPCASPASTCQGFDESKLAKYEQECNGDPDPLSTVISPQGKNYAISIGVPEEDIKVWEVEEVRKMVKEEVAKQWSRLSEAEKHGSTQQQAQRAILSYMHHEGDIPKFKMEGGQIVPLHDQDTFPPMSITKWKYERCKNKQYAAAWDIRYNIYLGVKEIFNIFKSNAISGEGEERWKKAIAYNFLPACPDCYWTGECSNEGWRRLCHPDVSIREWNAPYNNEPAYVCESALSLENPSSWYMSMCESMVSTNAPNWPDRETCQPGGDQKCTNPALKPTKSCSYTNQYLKVKCLPLACEEVSTAMVVKFYGNEIDAKTLWEKIGGCQSDVSNIPLIASSYGINCQKLSESELNREGIKKYLDRGIPVIAKGGRRSFGGGPQGTANYTYHVVVVTGIEGDYFIVNDPAFPPGIGVKYKISNWESESPGIRNGKDAWACVR